MTPLLIILLLASVTGTILFCYWVKMLGVCDRFIIAIGLSLLILIVFLLKMIGVI